MSANFKHGQITDLILKAFFQVYGKLGYGFSEKIYENSMAITSQNLGLTVIQQAPIAVYFDQSIVGHYAVDLLVNSLVIVEIKAHKSLTQEHEAQLLNYLKATPYEVGLLLNFGPRPQCKRRVYDNSLKGGLSWYKEVVLDTDTAENTETS
ncbi:MAG TPA: GxxExxY protein [Acidobacteriota bacterium]|jgi:GxxExxY protein|nr:GxxExxY protein [Acidobacteriota bacterium]